MQRTNSRPRAARTLFFLILVLGTPSVLAQSTWNGTVSTNWNTAGNWTGSIPNSSINAVIPAGTPNSPSTAGVATPGCQSLTVDVGATLTVASGSTLSVVQDATINGTIAGPGLLRFIGSNPSNCSGGGTFCSVEIAKLNGNTLQGGSNISIAGNLTLTSGGFFPGVGGFFTTTVSGNASMQAGTFGAFNGAGQLDVAGNVTFSGTSNTFNTGTIHCGGNWSSDAAYAPTQGNVIFNKVGSQSITTTGTLPHVFVAAGSITTAASLHVVSGLDVSGSLSVTPGSLDADAPVTVAATGTLALGNASNTFSSDLFVNGTLTASGVITFDGSSTSQLSGSGSFPSIQITKLNGNAVNGQSNISITGNLTLVSGGFFPGVGGNFTTTVSGQALMQGGTFGAFNGAGQLDVAGDITFSGTSVTFHTGVIHCGGNWTSDTNYAPTLGTVVFNKTGSQTLTSSGTLPEVAIAAGSSTSAASLHVVTGLFVGGSLAVTPGSLDADCPVTVLAGGTLTLGNASNTFSANLDRERDLHPERHDRVRRLVHVGDLGRREPAERAGREDRLERGPSGSNLTINGNLDPRPRGCSTWASTVPAFFRSPARPSSREARSATSTARERSTSPATSRSRERRCRSTPR